MSRKFSAADRVRSVRFALRGLQTMLIQEHNFRIHLAATIAVVVIGAMAGLTADEWRWIALAVTLVWLTEAFNTALERIGDAISLEHHPKIRIAKDVAAAGALIASMSAALIGLSVFLPYFIGWIAP